MLMFIICELICSAVRKIIKQKHLLDPVTKGEAINRYDVSM